MMRDVRHYWQTFPSVESSVVLPNRVEPQIFALIDHDTDLLQIPAAAIVPE
jgi:hypothetical protein